MDNAVKVGEYFRAKLTELSGKHPGTITEVRGMGMINGAELKDNEIGPKIVQKCFEQKVLINCTAGNVLRFIPPLIASEEEVDIVVAAIDKAMTERGCVRSSLKQSFNTRIGARSGRAGGRVQTCTWRSVL